MERGLWERVSTEYQAFDPARWLLTLLALVPFALGWLGGAVVRAALWLLAALIAGYKAGRGDEA